MEKIYNITKKYNFFPILATLCLFINAFLVIVFSNTSIRQTFFARALILTSSIVIIIAVLIELFNVIYNFIKTKEKIKFAIQLSLLVVSLALAIWGLAKYFTDFSVYYVHNNETNMIVASSIMVYLSYLAVQNFGEIKKKYLDFILVALVGVVSFILMITLLGKSNISLYYVYSVSLATVITTLLANFYDNIFKKTTNISFLTLAWIMFIATFIATLINRTTIDLINMVYLFLIIVLLISITITCNNIHKSTLPQFIIKIVLVLFAIALFIKTAYFTNTLKDYDLMRLLSTLVLIMLSISLIKDYKDKISIGYISLVGATTLAYIIFVSIQFSKKMYEVNFYKGQIAFVAIFGVLMIAYAITMLVLKTKEQKSKNKTE